MKKISEDEREKFHKNGFLLIKNCFSKEEIDEAIRKTGELLVCAGSMAKYYGKNSHASRKLCGFS